MRVCFLLCLFVCVTLCPTAYGYYGDDMAETIQLCCHEGAGFAKNHTLSDCRGTLTTPPEVPPAFETMCQIAKAQCCNQYFQKQVDCETGIDIATSSHNCAATKSTSKVCCDECSRGTKLGSSEGPTACVKRNHGMNPEELLAEDAFVTCCKKAAQDWKRETTPRNDIKLSVLPSLCEDYAPNELCAHHCIPVPGSYRCECNPGFMLMADGRNCKEVSKNRCKPRNPCHHKCNDNGVEVKCSCRRGYELMADGKSCQDIDECQLEDPVCLPGTQCHNLHGSYKCIPFKKEVEKGQCPPGFARNLNNNVCDDINECLLPNPPCPSFVCENTIGGYSCGGVTGNPINLSTSPRTHVEDRCPPGFKVGLHGECEDVDECAVNKHDCNPLSQFCINTHSSFYCQDKVSKHCPPGFKIDSNTNKCEDIDECEEGANCGPDRYCVNQLGQYDCKAKVEVGKEICPDGMRKKSGSLYCDDIDECVEGTHLCDQYQNCLNTNGSYECHCKLGFELDTITGACADVNECATGEHNCISQAQRCDNTVGSYLCIRITSCGTGYVLHHSTGKCEDIDECALNIHNCGSDYTCQNIRGSFRCLRKRTTTTSTTPDYEYYYDDSEEDNSTSTGDNQPKEPTTTTTETPIPQPQSPPTSSTTERTKNNEVEPPFISKHVPDLYKNETVEPTTTPVPERPSEPQPLPSQPLPTETEPPPTVTQPPPTVPQPPPTVPQPPPTVPHPPPTIQQQPQYPPTSTEQIPTYPVPRPTPSYQLPPYDIPESELPKIPTEKSWPKVYTTDTPKPTPPHQVNVKIENETGVVEGKRNKDGSVVIDTKYISKNEWTKVDKKPTECPNGFEADEYGSCFDIDECSTNRHFCSGLTETCRNTIGGYTCNCAPGFRRDLVSKTCEFITTSSSTTTTTPAPTLPTSTKKSFFWGYPVYNVSTVRPFLPSNLCDVGYHHNIKTGVCEDMNECTNGQANCAAVEICINTEGGYRCECPPNWKLDDVRHRCVPIKKNKQFPSGYGNEPVYPSVRPQPVIPDQGTKYLTPDITTVEQGSVFTCPAGYILGDFNTCVDVNECLTGEAKCGPDQLCSNLPGGYSCNCPVGHRLVGDHQCEDVDECALAGSVPACSQNADCLNTVGSYQCKCHTGFRSAPVNDKVCVDVDECMESRPGSLCQHRCNNVWGSYRCACHRGYRLNSDNSTCSDIDECTEFRSKIPCVGRCVNEPGSYRCACPKGYRLSEDKRSCIDIDECETGEAPCAKGGISTTSSDVCVNTRGSYRCLHISCPVGYQLENKHRCNKIGRVCPVGDWNCAHQPTTISYNFITFVSNLYIPESMLKLFTMRGPVWPYVKMRFELKVVNVNTPPSVKRKADINDFLLTQNNNEGLVSLVRPLEGPQSIELEMTMELYTHEQFGGTAVAKLFIYVSEYEF
nr:fibulin-2 [Helicoverpa armigera]